MSAPKSLLSRKRIPPVPSRLLKTLQKVIRFCDQVHTPFADSVALTLRRAIREGGKKA